MGERLLGYIKESTTINLRISKKEFIDILIDRIRPVRKEWNLKLVLDNVKKEVFIFRDKINEYTMESLILAQDER